MAQSKDDELFEQIVRANPDLTASGPETFTLRRGDTCASMPRAEFERFGAEVGEAIVRGNDFMTPWVAVAGQPKLMAWAIAEGAYRWAVLRAFRMPPFEAQQLLKRASQFLYFAATLRPEGEERSDG